MEFVLDEPDDLATGVVFPQDSMLEVTTSTREAYDVVMPSGVVAVFYAEVEG